MQQRHIQIGHVIMALALMGCSGTAPETPIDITAPKSIDKAVSTAQPAPDRVQITGGGYTLTIDPGTLAAAAADPDGQIFPVSEPAGEFEAKILSRTESTLEILLPERRIILGLATGPDHLQASIQTDIPGTLVWPRYRVSESSRFIYLMGDGRSVPVSDPDWAARLEDEKELMDSPLWGHSGPEGTIAWTAETPFRSRFSLKDGMFQVSHSFPVRGGSEQRIFRIRSSAPGNELLPARLYRSYLEDSGQFLSFGDKAGELPPGRADALKGALHVYLWGSNLLTARDVKPGSWISLAKAITADTDLGARLLDAMDSEQRSAVLEMAGTDWPYEYIKNQTVRGISRALEANPEQARRNLDEFISRYGEFLNPPETWGAGVSAGMIRDMQDAGITRARILLNGDKTGLAAAEAALAAEEAGYLFGIYDSYHSIHPSSLAGTDFSWNTAQFPPGLYETGGIMKENGEYYSGFQGVGRLLNAIPARPFFEQRVSDNLNAQPMTAYFLDTEAAGEIYEDYNPTHPSSSEDEARERRSRLAWLRREKGLVTGSEGGSPFIMPELLFSEGPFSTTFYWEDSDFRNRESRYWIGRFWPPEAPEINFRTIPLKPLFHSRYFDETTRLPLLETIFHDSTAVTNHWNSDMLKYAETESTLELLQLLYLNPPLYNLNRDRLEEEQDRITANFRFFSPLHEVYGFAQLEGFAHLTADRRVQRTLFAGGLEMVANFRDTTFEYEGTTLPPRSAAAFENGTLLGIRTP